MKIENNLTGARKWKNGWILTLFILSAAIGIALVAISVWEDYESILIETTYMGEKGLTTLSCPILITPRDKAEFSVTIRNQTDHNLTTTIYVMVSNGSLPQLKEDRVTIKLGPDETRRLAWPVNSEDAIHDKLVLVKVYQLRNYLFPSKHDTCGILVLDVPVLSGNQVVYGSLGLSMIGMLAGISLWQRNNRLMTWQQKELNRSMIMMTGTIVVGLGASLLGSWLTDGWLLGGSSLVVAVLLVVVTFYQMFKLDL